MKAAKKTKRNSIHLVVSKKNPDVTISRLRAVSRKWKGSSAALQVAAYKAGVRPIHIRKALKVKYLSIWPSKAA